MRARERNVRRPRYPHRGVAYRWVLAHQPLGWVEGVRPRRVDPELQNFEQ